LSEGANQIFHEISQHDIDPTGAHAQESYSVAKSQPVLLSSSKIPNEKSVVKKTHLPFGMVSTRNRVGREERRGESRGRKIRMTTYNELNKYI
jgi:hypothetical protein